MSNKDIDLLLGVSAKAMNEASESVFNVLYPDLFTGEYTIPDLNLLLSYDVKSSPVFQLEQSSTQTELITNLFETRGLQGLVYDEFIELLSVASKSFFSIYLESVFVTLRYADKQPVKIPMSVEAVGSIEVQNNLLYLSAITAKVKLQDEDPTLEKLLNDVFVPLLLDKLNSLLKGIDLPPLEFKGVNLSAPDAFIEDGYLVAVANLQGKGAPAQPVPFSHPASDIFVLLSDDLRKSAANTLIQSVPLSFNYSGKSGFKQFNVHYSISGKVSSPHVETDGNKFVFSGNITGSAKGGFKAIFPLDAGFKLYGKPNPKAKIAAELKGTQLDLIVKEVSPFVILATPSGSGIPGWAISIILTPIINRLTCTITPLLTQLIKDIHFRNIFTIPTITISVMDKHFSLSPSNLKIERFDNYMSVTGSITIGK